MAKISDYMQRILIEVSPDTTAAEAARRMEASNVGAVVVTSEGRVLGVLTERDLSRKIVGRGARPETAVLEIFERRGVPYVSPDAEIRVVSDAMRAAGTRYALVYDPIHPDRPLGIVAMQDILRAMMKQCESEQGALTNYVMGGPYA